MEVKSLVASGNGSIRMVTIASELEGAIEAIQWLASQDIVPAIGGLEVEVKDSIARLVSNGSLAGSTLTEKRSN